jgi:hypothetical protein
MEILGPYDVTKLEEKSGCNSRGADRINNDLIA